MATGDLPEQEGTLSEVRRGLDLLVAAVKKQAFYPEGNDALYQSFRFFREWLDIFWKDHEILHLDVQRTRLLYHGGTVYQEKPSERLLVYPLFRDGVQWLELLPGVTDDELLSLIRLINQYRTVGEQSENDLVTAIWEADFPSIKHKAIDKFWEADTVVDISSLKASPDATEVKIPSPVPQPIPPPVPPPIPASATPHTTAVGLETIGLAAISIIDTTGKGDRETGTGFLNEADGGKGSLPPEARELMERLTRAQSAALAPQLAGAGQKNYSFPNSSETLSQFWKLTAEEEDILKNLVEAEEQRNSTRDCLKVLLVLVLESLEGPDRVLLQEFILDEVRKLLTRCEFATARGFVEELRAIKEEDRSGASRLAGEIIRKISTVNVLGVLNQQWPQLRAMPKASCDNLHHLLLLLSASVIDTLVPMVVRSGDPRIQAILIDAIAHQTTRSRADITTVVTTLPTALICELIGNYAYRNRRAPFRLLSDLTRHRDSPVREAAARALVADNPQHLEAVFHLIDDPDRNVRSWLLEYMGGGRNALAERLLRDYLEKKLEGSDEQDEKFILECYQALAGCASRETVTFLRTILMKRSWRAFIGIERAAHRTGAAIALSLMPSEWGSREVLEDAQHSHVLGIRRAHTRARQKTQILKRDSHD